MTNREVFVKDPTTWSLLNHGVAEVADAETQEQLRTLRYELETFVCEGEYEHGLSRILHAYLTNLDRPEQPAAWVSGFYGSGKSHLLKMLRYLWVDYRFPDGATARGLANLSTPVRDLFKELDTAGKRHGGLHAASGKLGAAAGGNIRLGLLAIVVRSAGLPAEYYTARFVMWLKAKGLLEPVQRHLAAAGSTLAEELQDMYVSPLLASALLAADPGFAGNAAEAKKLLAAEYPKQDAVSIDDVIEAIRKALTVGRRFPCTLIALDEIQQQIGEHADRSYEIQELAEACSKRFAGKLMLVGSGQSALSGTPLLQRLMGRFTVTIDLLDTDVEAVTRKMVLAKKIDKAPDVAAELNRAQGEISRHLVGTQIEPRAEDQQVLVPDYPLLPVRRRFWERALRAVDQGGTTAQLRTQLRIVHEAVCQIADRPLGHVIPADVVFDQNASAMRQSGALPQDVHEAILKPRDGTPKGLLRSRLCALIFLIGKLPRDAQSDLGIRANPDMLADLLVEDLRAGSASLRVQIPALIHDLLQAKILMPLETEYRLQTPESSAWNNDYQQRFDRLRNDVPRLSSALAELLAAAVRQRLEGLKKLPHGQSKTPRKVELHFGADAPVASEGTIPVWVRDGWSSTENAVRADALRDKTDSPTVYVFLHKVADGELKKAVAAYQAATDTLDARGTPTTNTGRDAQTSIETRRKEALAERDGALESIFQATLVLQAGGAADVSPGAALADKVKVAAETALSRLYPQFDLGDDPRWDRVIERARQGAGAPLEVLEWEGNTESHPVCAAVRAHLGAGKKGADVRKHFEGDKYGWPLDTVYGALLALCSTGHVRCVAQGKELAVKQIERTKLGQYEFRPVTVVITTPQRIALKGLFQEAGVVTRPNEEAQAASAFLEVMQERAAGAGGEPPLPAVPATRHLQDLAALSGNEQLLELYNRREQLRAEAAAWRDTAEAIRRRQPRWQELQRLLRHGASLPAAAEVRPQADALLAQRSLLSEPDPVPPLCATLTQALRAALGQARTEYETVHRREMLALTAAEAWQRLGAADRAGILARHGLAVIPDIDTGAEAELLASLDRLSLEEWGTRRDALPQRFQNALLDAARRQEPTATPFPLPRRTIKSVEELDAWAAGVRQEVLKRLADGPVIIS